ncbi:MAG: hypothetical protein U0R52_01010 [Solirubrobacterales bacterium]
MRISGRPIGRPGPLRLSGPLGLAGLLGLLAAVASPATAGTATGSGLGPYPDLGRCKVFPDPPARLSPRAASMRDERAWNQDVYWAPVARRSHAVVSYINHHGGNFLHPDFGSPRAYGFPYAVVGRHQRHVPIHYTAYGNESDRGPFPIPAHAPIENGRHSDGDRHVLVVDRHRCRLYELYRAFYKVRGHDHWNADSGVSWNLRSRRRRTEGYTSADAAGLPIFPGLVRYDEVRRGWIGHAIRVTVDQPRDAWVHPASHCAGDNSSRAAPPMGMRLRLRRSYSIRRLSGAAEVIARALKHYGMIVADQGSNWFISGTSDPRWNDRNLDQLKSIPGRAFQVVRSAARVHSC